MQKPITIFCMLNFTKKAEFDLFKSRYMRLSLKYQLIQITEQLAYKAYGFRIQLRPEQVPLIISSHNQREPYFKFPVPQMIYEQYRKDGFIYSDPGITPKIIAEDILVHFQQQGHIQMQSDQFGNMLAFVKQKYFQQKYQKIISQNKIACMKCEEYDIHLNQSQNMHNAERRNQQCLTTLILFKQNQKTSNLTQLRQVYVNEAISAIQQQIFHHDCKIINLINEERYLQHRLDHLYQNQRHNSENNILIQEKSQKNKIFVSCLRHQIIEKEAQTQKLFKKHKINHSGFEIKYLKFANFFPEKIHFLQTTQVFEAEQKNKLKRIIFDHEMERPIDLWKIRSSKDQYIEKTKKNTILVPKSLKQLLLHTQQLLSQVKISDLFHLSLALQQIQNQQQPFIYNTSKQSEDSMYKRYRKAARITKDHLKELLSI